MGPLSGLKVVEVFCIGPGPFAGMLLSDMGADVILVDRMEEGDYGYPDHPYRYLFRNRRSIRLDLKDAEGVETLLRLVDEADGLIEGMRPGVLGGLAGGTWVNRRKSNLVDGGDWRYGTWQSADGRYVSTALLQPKFLRAFRDKSGIDLSGLSDPDDRDAWPAYRRRMAALFATRTRDEWVALFDGDDDTVMPVLDLEEAPRHPQNRDREAFVEVDSTHQPAPAPRFSRTPSEVRNVAPRPGQGGAAALADWGFGADEIERLRARGAFQ